MIAGISYRLLCGPSAPPAFDSTGLFDCVGSAFRPCVMCRRKKPRVVSIYSPIILIHLRFVRNVSMNAMQLPAKALRESVSSCLHGRRRWSAAGSEVAIYWAIAGCELLILIMWAMSLRVKTKTTPQALERVRTTTEADQNATLQTMTPSPGIAQRASRRLAHSGGGGSGFGCGDSADGGFGGGSSAGGESGSGAAEGVHGRKIVKARRSQSLKKK